MNIGEFITMFQPFENLVYEPRSGFHLPTRKSRTIFFDESIANLGARLWNFLPKDRTFL